MHDATQRFDVIVVGGGPMGLSTAYHLGKRKARTLVLEQFTFVNQLGSSAGVSRQFRIPYPDAYMVKRVKQSIPNWDELQGLTPQPLMDTVGTLVRRSVSQVDRGQYPRRRERRPRGAATRPLE
ncbi:FAD-dependent oxidoreductase [Burkholderia lata]|uniref:FAD-dependent oxidoreductase n=1 Tax=Burkholderia lata (strain ATCC 17760 / DSM 23089 / LMG 22485 / NCIMB 9086 / R18194 / 383) TaxID=482957 RepID=UPI00399B62EF